MFLGGVDDFCKTASVRGDDDRGGYDSRTLIMRVGKLELRVPQDRQRRFSTQLFDRYQRVRKRSSQHWHRCTCKRGFHTPKSRPSTEELCGEPFFGEYYQPNQPESGSRVEAVFPSKTDVTRPC